MKNKTMPFLPSAIARMFAEASAYAEAPFMPFPVNGGFGGKTPLGSLPDLHWLLKKAVKSGLEDPSVKAFLNRIVGVAEARARKILGGIPSLRDLSLPSFDDITLPARFRILGAQAAMLQRYARWTKLSDDDARMISDACVYDFLVPDEDDAPDAWLKFRAVAKGNDVVLSVWATFENEPENRGMALQLPFSAMEEPEAKYLMEIEDWLARRGLPLFFADDDVKMALKKGHAPEDAAYSFAPQSLRALEKN